MTALSIVGSAVPVPVDLVAPRSYGVAMTIVLAALSAVVLMVGLVMWQKHGATMVLVLLAGALLSSVHEPAIDIIETVFYPPQHQWTAFETFGRPIPVWTVLAYGLYLGALPALFIHLVQRGANRRQLIAWLSVVAVFELSVELPLLHAGVYSYYGPQPFRIAGLLPLHILVLNTSIVLTVVSLYLVGARLLPRKMQPLLILLPYAAVISVTTALGAPIFNALNSDLSRVAVWTGGALTILGSAALCHVALGVAATEGAAYVRRPQLAHQP